MLSAVIAVHGGRVDGGSDRIVRGGAKWSCECLFWCLLFVCTRLCEGVVGLFCVVVVVVVIVFVVFVEIGPVAGRGGGMRLCLDGLTVREALRGVHMAPAWHRVAPDW
jgi:hypothetical protein